jgi:hypothetical protein
MQRSNRGAGASVRPEARTPWAPEARRSRHQSAVAVGLRAGVAAAIGWAAFAPPAMAQEAAPPVITEPPRAGHEIVVFPQRNMIEAIGYENGTSVEIKVIGTDGATTSTTGVASGDDPATPEFEGAVEVNHPGGTCWPDGQTPDIKAGDKIVATADSASDATTVANVTAGDYARYVRENPTDPTSLPVRDADGNYQITLSGKAERPATATTPAGYPPDSLEARLVNPARFSNGARTVRADTSGNSEGTLDYNPTTGNWSATWTLSEADAAKAVDAEPRIMWLGQDPAAGAELTIFEFGVGDEGCGAGEADEPFPLGVFAPAPAGVTQPIPANDLSVEVFPSRNFVAIGGLAPRETAKVEVVRYLVPEGSTTPQPVTVGVMKGAAADADGVLEVNHPGGACWDTFPDIRPLDHVRVTAGGRTRQTTVQDAFIVNDTFITGGGAIRVEGEVRTPQGAGWPQAAIDQLEVRLRNKAFLPFVGKQDLRANIDGGVNNELAVDTVEKTFVATFRQGTLSDDAWAQVKDVATDPATEQRIMWLGSDPAAESEATIFERGSEVTGGAECDPAPPAGAPVRDEPIVTPPDPDAPPAQVVGPQADGSILVPGIGGLTTLRGPDGQQVLAAQVDAQSLAKLVATGVVSVVLEQKARPNGVLYRFKIRKAGGGTGRAAFVAAGAKPRGKAIATFWRAAPKKAGKYRFTLKSRALRGLKPGRYVIDVTGANAKKKVSGKTVSVSFRVR